MDCVLRVEDLNKTYRKGFIPKRVKVLQGVSFKIYAGTITGFIGSNGSGKTTTIKCLLELAFPDSGTIEFFGQKNLTPALRGRIGFLPERPYFYEYLTGFEFLKFYGELSMGFGKRQLLRERILTLLNKVGLTHAKDRPLRTYSKGMLQRIGIAQALIHNPEFVILDEPMTGLDPDGRWEVTEIIRETASLGTAIFFSSHLLNDAEKICTHLVILNNGKVRFEGPTESLLNQNESVIHLYFRRGSHPVEELIGNEINLQARIDQLRKENCEIFEIKRERKGLEEAFRQIANERVG